MGSTHLLQCKGRASWSATGNSKVGEHSLAAMQSKIVMVSHR
jgi:hypothetical protein